MATGILELVQFKLIDGKNDADLASTHEDISEFLKEQPGFMYRSISRCEDGTYVDIVYWNDKSSAKKASDALMQDSRGQAMLALCDMNSVSMQHLPILSEVMSASCEEAA
jgi:hypothetical protein